MLQTVPLPAECKKFCKLITFNKRFTGWSNRFKITVHKQLLKTLGTHLFCQHN